MRDLLGDLTQYCALTLSCLSDQCVTVKDKERMARTGTCNILWTTLFAFSAAPVAFQAQRTLHHLCSSGTDVSSRQVSFSRATPGGCISRDGLEVV